MIDFVPATAQLSRLIAGVGQDRLSAPTPCPSLTAAALLDHVRGFSFAFTRAARKDDRDQQGPPPQADAANLDPFWRVTIPASLAALAEAWADEAAWSGMTRVGGADLPGEVAGMFALDEVVVHGWDLAVATGQRGAFDDGLLAPLCEFVAGVVAQSPEGSPGLFGKPVPVDPDAPLLDRLLGLTGRDPGRRATG